MERPRLDGGAAGPPVVVETPDDGTAQTIFDGYVLSHKVHLETGVTASTLDVWGQDASVLMGLEDKARWWQRRLASCWATAWAKCLHIMPHATSY